MIFSVSHCSAHWRNKNTIPISYPVYDHLSLFISVTAISFFVPLVPNLWSISSSSTSVLLSRCQYLHFFPFLACFLHLPSIKFIAVHFLTFAFPVPFPIFCVFHSFILLFLWLSLRALKGTTVMQYVLWTLTMYISLIKELYKQVVVSFFIW